MPINSPNSFESSGKAVIPGSGAGDGVIKKAEADLNVELKPASGTGTVTAFMQVDTARIIVPVSVPSNPDGYYWPGSEILLDWETGSTLTAGKVYYWSALGSWQPADAGTDGFSLMAICSDTNDGSEMVFKGYVETNQTFSSGDITKIVYLTNSGTLSVNKPTTSGDWVRVMGYIKSTSAVYLDVSNDFYQVP